MRKEYGETTTTLHAQNIDDVVELERLEKMLLYVGCSPIISVANWSQHPQEVKWRTDSLMYRTDFMIDLYDFVGRYV